MSKKRKCILSTVIVLAVIIIAVMSVLLFHKTALQRSDFRRIASEEYDTVFLSMYPIDHYSESDFSYYRGMTVFKADNMITGFSEIRRYLKHISDSGNSVSSVYLGVRPDLVSVRQLSSLVQNYPSMTFEFILSYPSAVYWQNLPETEYTCVLKSYRDFLSEAPSLSDARFYFYAAEEWLIANPSLYEGELCVNANAANFIFTHSDFLHDYMITPEKTDSLSSALEQLTHALRVSAPVYPNLSDIDIVFFGDSVFGNYNDDMSIPGAVRALTGAVVYNCGYGGNSAAMADDTPISLPGIVKAFFEEDLSLIPTDRQIFQGFTEYFNVSHTGRKTCFVINYGLNDYFEKYPIQSSDPMDITTYAGAIRTAVAEIKEKSADSQIILCTPTYSNYTPPNSDDSIPLQSYADSVLALAEELDVDVLDFFYTLGINADNFEEYLIDLIHPNEKGRFMIAQRIISAVR